jgi:hypothetical protein
MPQGIDHEFRSNSVFPLVMANDAEIATVPLLRQRKKFRGTPNVRTFIGGKVFQVPISAGYIKRHWVIGLKTKVGPFAGPHESYFLYFMVTIIRNSKLPYIRQPASTTGANRLADARVLMNDDTGMPFGNFPSNR